MSGDHELATINVDALDPEDRAVLLTNAIPRSASSSQPIYRRILQTIPLVGQYFGGNTSGGGGARNEEVVTNSVERQGVSITIALYAFLALSLTIIAIVYYYQLK